MSDSLFDVAEVAGARRRIAVLNERTKLRANALDRLSTAAVTVGVIAPLAAAFWGPGQGSRPLTFYLAAVYVFALLAAALHLIAMRLLRGLR
jgi:hypothetical protein